MDYEAMIQRYYPEDDALRRLLLSHSRQVADRCLAVCRRHPELGLDERFVEEAAMLHDIGIRWCHAPSIHCEGTEHYLRHGFIGGELLRREGFPKHARVCERHTGTGLATVPTTVDAQGRIVELLPAAMVHEGFFVPETLTEQLVCYADKFFSKSHPERVLTVEQAAQSLERFGHEGVMKFLTWAKMFEM